MLLPHLYILGIHSRSECIHQHYTRMHTKRIGGFLIPFFIVFLFLIGYQTTAITLCILVIFPYFISIPPQPWICRFYVKIGAHYFDGGCSVNFEARPPSSNAAPVCAGVHPHGLLCLGYFLCCGLRSRAIENVTNAQMRAEFMGKAALSELIHRVPCKGIIVGYLCRAPLFNLMITKLTGWHVSKTFCVVCIDCYRLFVFVK